MCGESWLTVQQGMSFRCFLTLVSRPLCRAGTHTDPLAAYDSLCPLFSVLGDDSALRMLPQEERAGRRCLLEPVVSPSSTLG